MPLLFSVCGIAQATAGARAIRQALSAPVAAGVEPARDLLVQIETAREHLWRIVIDWPQRSGARSAAQSLAPIQSMVQSLRRTLFVDGDAFSLAAQVHAEQGAVNELIARLDDQLTAEVFGCAPTQWLQIEDPVELGEWTEHTESIAAGLLRHVASQAWQALGATAGDCLPNMSATELNRRLAADDSDRFIAAPMWRDRVFETTPLARQRGQRLIESLRREYGNGLLTRLAARLVELARIPSAMRETAAAALVSVDPMMAAGALPPGVGIAQVEAARGRLVHRVVLADGRVTHYQILAPTEWNFHPAGVVARALASLPEIDEARLREMATMLVNAVDPCVGYDLQVHADA